MPRPERGTGTLLCPPVPARRARGVVPRRTTSGVSEKTCFGQRPVIATHRCTMECQTGTWRRPPGRRPHQLGRALSYDRQALLISWLFAILGEDEVAVTSLHVAGTTSFDAEAALGALSTSDQDHLQEAMSTLMSDDDLQWGNFSQATGLKAAALDTSGPYLAEPVTRDIQTPASGSSTGLVYPADTVVVSLRSPSTFGEANRGRMYLPHVAITRVTATPFMNGTNIGNVA